MLLDTEVDRKNSNCVKWNVLSACSEPELLPMWIADMDIAVPCLVTDAIRSVLNRKTLGYVEPSSDFYSEIISWQRQRHSVSLTPDQILLAPSVVTGLSLAVRHLTDVNDKLVVLAPHYPPYKEIVTNNGRRLVALPMKIAGGQYQIDFARLADTLADPQVTAMIFCNPHNPGGRVWTREEIIHLNQLAEENDVLLMSDEIHNDIYYSGHKTVSMLEDGLPVCKNVIVFNSASKAFNLAGAKVSYVFSQNNELLRKLATGIQQECMNEINTLGLAATKTAYAQCKDWLTEVTGYLQENRNFAAAYFKNHLPNIRVMIPEATYMFWLDFSQYDLSCAELMNALVHRAKLYLNPGIDYGAAGAGFMRLNFAVDRSVLQEGLRRLEIFDELATGKRN